MSVLSSHQRQFLEALSLLAYCNPFLPERIELERRALGEQFNETRVVWSKQADWETPRPNVVHLQDRCEQLANHLRERLFDGSRIEPVELQLYDDLIAYVLYGRYRERLAALDLQQTKKTLLWESFRAEHEHFFVGAKANQTPDAAHLFACCFQICRAFRNIFHHIVGSSLPAARLRAEVWQSIFTHDMRRYRESLYGRMGDFTTLITGPSGTGKELVAEAIAKSRYIPWDARRGEFQGDFSGAFYPLNLSALSPTLIESELFGHRRGAFTGAVDDRVGWLQACPALGSVFLDEVGDLDPLIQVKLLRVLQTREFQRLGESADQRFEGKIIAATHQNLPERIEQGTFRRDFYFRLCSDMIATPSLQEQLADKPDDLPNLIESIVLRVAGEGNQEVCEQVSAWIEQRLGIDYPWPGNFRELEQCVRNIIVRGSYHPARGSSSDARQRVAAELLSGSLTAEELLSRYCTMIYSQNGNYEETARQVKLDRRTVKSKIDQTLLKELS